MKKKIYIPVLVCFVFGLLCSCTDSSSASGSSISPTPAISPSLSRTTSPTPEAGNSDTEMQSSPQPSESTIALGYTDRYAIYVENGKRGLVDADGNVVLKAEYDAVSVRVNKAPLMDVFFAGIATESTTPTYQVFGSDGKQIGPDYSYIGCGNYHVTYNIVPPVPPFLAVIYYDGTNQSQREYWLLNAEGKPYHDLPYEEADLSDTEFHAVRDGDEFRFTRDYILKEENKAGVYETYFDGKYQRYVVHDTRYMSHCGLLDSEGNMLFEPVYCRIEVPFEDIILLYEGAYQGPEYTAAKLVSPDGNVWCSRYNHMAFSVLQDGRYICVAFSRGIGGEGPVTHDDNGDIMPHGYWFVDYRGDPVSERYETIRSCDEGLFNFNIDDENDTFTVTTDSGEEKIITAKDILLTRDPEKEPTADRYIPLVNEHIICETIDYSYIEVSESIDDGDELTNKSQDYIYKVDREKNEHTLIYKSPEHTRYFDFRFMHEKWIYVTVYNYFVEPYVIGFGRINMEADTFETIGSSGQHGLIYYNNCGYYFWRGVKEDKTDAGIYRLDPSTGMSVKIADLWLPLEVQVSGSGQFYRASGNQLFFTWGIEDSRASFVVDIETGEVKRT